MDQITKFNDKNQQKSIGNNKIVMENREVVHVPTIGFSLQHKKVEAKEIMSIDQANWIQYQVRQKLQDMGQIFPKSRIYTEKEIDRVIKKKLTLEEGLTHIEEVDDALEQ